MSQKNTAAMVLMHVGVVLAVLLSAAVQSVGAHAGGAAFDAAHPASPSAALLPVAEPQLSSWGGRRLRQRKRRGHKKLAEKNRTLSGDGAQLVGITSVTAPLTSTAKPSVTAKPTRKPKRKAAPNPRKGSVPGAREGTAEGGSRIGAVSEGGIGTQAPTVAPDGAAAIPHARKGGKRKKKNSNKSRSNKELASSAASASGSAAAAHGAAEASKEETEAPTGAATRASRRAARKAKRAARRQAAKLKKQNGSPEVAATAPAGAEAAVHGAGVPGSRPGASSSLTRARSAGCCT